MRELAVAHTSLRREDGALALQRGTRLEEQAVENAFAYDCPPCMHSCTRGGSPCSSH